MKAVAWILSLAVLWAVTGAIAAWGLQAFLGIDGWIISCGSLNVAIGMALLQLSTQDEHARRFFYENIKPHEDYFNFGIVLLWGFPIVLVFSGLLWWIVSKFTS